MKGIVLYSVLPLRAEAREGAEQLTQLLFGETCEILRTEGRWTEIINDADGQQGWVDAKMMVAMNDEEAATYTKQLAETTAFVRMPMAFAVSRNNQTTIPLTAGTRLCNYHVSKENAQIGVFEALGVEFHIDPTMVMTQYMPLNRDSLMLLGRFLLNAPYLWGGKNALGMDCSGLTQILLSMMGVRVKRNASEQAQQGEPVASLAESKACDLAFFDHGDGKVTHVGILLGNGTIMHCSGRVKVEKITEEGILSSENNALYNVGEVSHLLHSIRRFKA